MLARESGVVRALYDVTGALNQVELWSIPRPQSLETSHQKENNELINTARSLRYISIIKWKKKQSAQHGRPSDSPRLTTT
jgi:hypothetical protein